MRRPGRWPGGSLHCQRRGRTCLPAGQHPVAAARCSGGPRCRGQAAPAGGQGPAAHGESPPVRCARLDPGAGHLTLLPPADPFLGAQPITPPHPTPRRTHTTPTHPPPCAPQSNTDLLDKPSVWIVGGDGWAYDVSRLLRPWPGCLLEAHTQPVPSQRAPDVPPLVPVGGPRRPSPTLAPPRPASDRLCGAGPRAVHWGGREHSGAGHRGVLQHRRAEGTLCAARRQRAR